ncbi:MAG: hypothetical protein IPL08_14015 [Saprospiraceae bacterium]|nr:hypothetical protein [Saprospiraceae bacterium]
MVPDTNDLQTNVFPLVDPEGYTHANSLHMERKADPDGNLTSVFSDKMGRELLTVGIKVQTKPIPGPYMMTKNRGQTKYIHPYQLEHARTNLRIQI